MRRGRVGRTLAAASAAAAAAAGGAAASNVVVLPSPTSAFRSAPPLRGLASATAERRIPGSVSARTLVRAALGPDGRPLRVVAVNRLLLRGTGDYTFTVPVPADAAARGPGSASEPGLRRGAILWQGFAVKRRLLVATITLAAAAARSLPLRLSFTSGRATIENATAASAIVETAPAPPVAVARRLDAARAAVAAGRGFTATTVTASGPTRTVAREFRAPLRVTGVYRFGNGRLHSVSATVGDAPLRLRGRGRLAALDLTVAPVAPVTILKAPGGGTWRASGALARNPVRFAASRLLEAALATQYETFLANPDPVGASSTVYRFVLDPDSKAAPGTGGSNSTAWWIWAVVGLATAAALTAGAAVWAHS